MTNWKWSVPASRYSRTWVITSATSLMNSLCELITSLHLLTYCFLSCDVVVVVTAMQVVNQLYSILSVLRFLVYWYWIRAYRVSTSTLVVPPTHHSTIGDHAFPVTSSTSLSAFRRRLKTVLFSRCFGLDSVWNFCSMFYSDCILFYCKVFLQS